MATGPGSTSWPNASNATANTAATGPASWTTWTARCGNARRRLLTELVRGEREQRPGAGESPTTEKYVRRFPDDRAAVAAAFGIAERADL